LVSCYCLELEEKEQLMSGAVLLRT